MRNLLIPIIFFSVTAFANETIKSDTAWAAEYMKTFKHKMLLEYVYKVLKQRKDEVSFYNNCIESFEYPIGACEKGYSLVTTIRLPGNDRALGKGDLQMYFSFNDKQQLISTTHELYYPELHN